MAGHVFAAPRTSLNRVVAPQVYIWSTAYERANTRTHTIMHTIAYTHMRTKRTHFTTCCWRHPQRICTCAIRVYIYIFKCTILWIAFSCIYAHPLNSRGRRRFRPSPGVIHTFSDSYTRHVCLHVWVYSRHSLDKI